jgi:hypothetical protein
MKKNTKKQEVKNPNIKTWKIPVTWEMAGIVEVEAETLDEAIETFDKDNDFFELPIDTEYHILGSFKRDFDEEYIMECNA